MEGKKMVRLTVRVDSELYGWYKREAERKGMGNHIGLNREVKRALYEYRDGREKEREMWNKIADGDLE